MNRKLVITANETQVISVLFENDEAVELHCSDRDAELNQISLGNIYVGRVKKIVSNINAAFIEVANGTECYFALEQSRTAIFTRKLSSQKDLCIGDELLVQIQKEAVKSKVPTVTGNLNFQGKYLVLTSGVSKIGVSAKIAKDRRRELLISMEKYRSNDVGFVVRTNAKDIDNTCLYAEAEALLKQYRHIREIADKRTCYSCLYAAPAAYITGIRNIYQDGLSEIIVEDQDIHTQIKMFLSAFQPEDLVKLRRYQDALLPLHKLYSVDTVLKKALMEKVWLKSGAYLVIQPTEALTVIDVNTGKAVGKKEEYLKYNLEAAKETARQIRLRNLSGIILVDFINMKQRENLEHLLDVLRKYLNQDPIPTTLVDVTKLQLVEITRQKIRKPLSESMKRS